MILAIRTDKPVSEIYFIDPDSTKTVASKQWEAHRQLADTIHQVITDLMSQSKINQEQLSAIIVYKGPGSFTGLRIGVSVANTYAYALNIPIVGCSGDDWLIDGIQSIKQNINEKIITPEYGGKINITSPKK